MSKQWTASIVGAVGVPACYGGFETLVENLIGSSVPEFTVYCSSKQYDQKTMWYKGARLRYIALRANGVQSILYDIIAILDSVRRGHQSILVLGVSGAIALPVVRLISNARIVTNIDGLEWKREKWGKLIKWYLKTSEWIAVKCSHVVIADNQAIADHVEHAYGLESIVIAYGGDHALVKAGGKQKQGYALSLCRIEPENNVHMILEAFARSGQKLKFVGNWNKSEYGRNLKNKYEILENIEVIDPVYDLVELYTLRAGCDFYVHGHSAGGTNPSLVEIMHFGKCVVAYDCNYNRATTEDKASYFSNSEELELASWKSEAEHNSIGSDMLSIAARRYTWNIVRKQYISALDPGLA